MRSAECYLPKMKLYLIQYCFVHVNYLKAFPFEVTDWLVWI